MAVRRAGAFLFATADRPTTSLSIDESVVVSLLRRMNHVTLVSLTGSPTCTLMR